MDASKTIKPWCSLLIFLLMFFAVSRVSALEKLQPVTVLGLQEQANLLGTVDLDNSTEHVAHELRYVLEQAGFILATPKITGEREVTVSFGAIKTVSVSGFSAKVTAKIRAYLAQVQTTKPHIDAIDKALALINDMPTVMATIAFKKLDTDGDFEAVVTGFDKAHAGLVMVDSMSRTVGGDTRYQVFENFNSAFTGGDLVRLQGSFVDNEDLPNQRSVYAAYTYPLNLSGTYLEVSAGDFETDVPVEGTSSVVTTNTGLIILPGAANQYNFEGQSASVSLGHPFIRQHGEAAYVLGGVDWSKENSETVGDTKNISADASLFYRQERPDGKSYAAGITLGGGRTDSYHTGDTGNFAYLQGSLGAITPVAAISPYTELRFELFGQLATQDTPGSKLLGLGSEDFLRGYENSTFLGATGFRGSVEIAHAYYLANSTIDSIVPLAFIDAGAVRNSRPKATDISRPKNDSLASTGVGVRLSVLKRASVESFVGFPLMEDASGETPSPRVYLRLSWGW